MKILNPTAKETATYSQIGHSSTRRKPIEIPAETKSREARKIKVIPSNARDFMKDLEAEAREYVANNIYDPPEESDVREAYIAGALAERKRSEWVSVTERLPEDQHIVLIAGIDSMFEGENIWFRTVGSLTTGTDAQGNKIQYWIDWSHESMIDDVALWQPLPEVPSTESITPKEKP